eukprot:296369-Prymnesium_polylepis.1
MSRRSEPQVRGARSALLGPNPWASTTPARAHKSGRYTQTATRDERGRWTCAQTVSVQSGGGSGASGTAQPIRERILEIKRGSATYLRR